MNYNIGDLVYYQYTSTRNKIGVIENIANNSYTIIVSDTVRDYINDNNIIKKLNKSDFNFEIIEKENLPVDSSLIAVPYLLLNNKRNSLLLNNIIIDNKSTQDILNIIWEELGHYYGHKISK